MKSYLGIYVEAWATLHARRAAGFGPSPVALSEIKALLDLMGWRGAARLDFTAIVCRMDDAWLKWARRKTEQHGRNDSNRSRRGES